MYKALYRKWRSRDFDEVCGQEQVTEILKYQISTGHISHAYLFCGSRGTGKTSCAKIFAKAVNCLSPRDGNPCLECEACRAIDAGTTVDVIEMDAASNNSVDNVRDMKEEISFTPADMKYRVYIIDEVHMMSPSAFNALLKTLEEPPPHVIFILATTELQKLPATIISRCQRYDFRRMSMATLISRMKYISEQEGIDLTDDGAAMLARLAKGGMRDAVSLLELCASSGRPITSELVCELVGVSSRDRVYDVISYIAARDYGGIYTTVGDVVNSASDITVWWGDLCDAYRDLMVVKVLPSAQSYLDLTDHEFAKLSELSSKLAMGTLVYQNRLLCETMQQLQRPGISKRSLVEMALSRMCEPALSKDTDSLLSRIEVLERELTVLRTVGSISNIPDNLVKEDTKIFVDNPGQKEAPASAHRSGAASVSRLGAVRGWREIVEKFEMVKPNLVGLFRNASPEFDEHGTLCVRMQRSFRIGNLEKDRETLALFLSLVKQFNPGYEISNGFKVIDTTKINQEDPFGF